ncbi:MAG: fimbrillin family protein, partial [Bacteroides sp.]
MKKHTLILAVIAITLIACGESKDDPVLPSVPIQILGEIETRTVENAWNTNDSIGVFMIKRRQELNAGNIVENADNRKYVNTLNLSFIPKDENQTIYYPVNGDSVDFIAYFPYTKLLKTNYIYPIDLTNQDNPKTLDLLYGKVTGKLQTDPILNFSFKHKLSKLVLEVEAGAG